MHWRISFHEALLYLYLTIGFAVYAPALGGPFVFDDLNNIALNPYVHDLRFAAQHFVDSRTHNLLPENSPYRPLLTLTYSLLWGVGGGSTIPFHVYKVILHVLCAWLTFLLSRQVLVRLGMPRFWQREGRLELGERVRVEWGPEAVAVLGSLVFLVHPGLSETVSYISSTSTLQCSLLYLVALWFHLRGVPWAVGLCFLASLLTKEEGATLPAVILLVEVLQQLARARGSRWWERLRESLRGALRNASGSLLACALVLALYGLLQIEFNSGSVVFSDVDRWPYFLTQARAWMYYLAWIFVPTGYAIEHTGFGFSRSLLEPAVAGSMLATLAALGWAFVRSGIPGSPRTASPYIAFCVGWYLLTLLPASSVFPLAEPINEHRYYLAYSLLFPGLAGAAGALLLAGAGSVAGGRLLVAGAMSLVLGLSHLTRAEARGWDSEESVWLRACEIDPTNGRAHLNLGDVYLSRGEAAPALEQFRECARLWPTYGYCYAAEGQALAALGRPSEADSALRQALGLAPDAVAVLHSYARFLAGRPDRTAEAREIARRCDHLSGGRHLPCLNIEAEAASKAGDLPAASGIAQRVLAIDPENAEARLQIDRARSPSTPASAGDAGPTGHGGG